MKLKDIDRWLTQITDLVETTSSRLNQVANLESTLNEKLDRFAAKVDKVAGIPTGSERAVDRLEKKVDRLANISAGAAQKIEELADDSAREKPKAEEPGENTNSTASNESME